MDYFSNFPVGQTPRPICMQIFKLPVLLEARVSVSNATIKIKYLASVVQVDGEVRYWQIASILEMAERLGLCV